MLSKLIQQFSKYALDQPAPFLRYTTAVIYAISTAAQSGGLVINKSIPPEEKKFLLLQEIINGALELGTFLTIATGFENLGRKLVDKGVIVAAETAKANPAFRKGVAMAFSLFGTIVAFNLVTPLLRNPIAAVIQSKFMKKKIDDKQQLTRPMLPSYQLNSNVRVVNNNPFANFERKMSPIKMQTRQPAFTSGGMRI